MLNQGYLGIQERIGVGLVRANGSAQNNQQVGVSDRLVKQVIDRGFTEGNIPALAFHDGREQAQILECNVPESDR